MAQTRWEPSLSREWNGFQNQMRRLFEGPWTGASAFPGLAVSYPPVNIWEDDNNVFAEAELPGMPLDKLEIYVNEGNLLSIQGERQAGDTQKGVWHRQERGFGKFTRTIKLPVTVDADKVEAKFENGVLFITLPKAELAKPKKINVKAE